MAAAIQTQAQPQEATPPAWKALAPTPPMGWNSYDAFGSSVTEEEVLANAAYQKKHLLKHGWNYVVIDYRWSDATAAEHASHGIGGLLTMDAYGRLLPAPNRFPSAANANGFRPLADKIHAMGFKFGIHVMRGIPRQAVQAKTPIEGSKFNAFDAATNPESRCSWCADMTGVIATTQAGQDYYDSLFRLYASWGVDFVKVDDLSKPYHKDEIEAIRRALDRCGRPIVLSTSPGPTPTNQRDSITANANMWRISGDFWDNWADLNKAFDLIADWQGAGGPGHWPDADMIPFGRVAIRVSDVGKDRRSRFTRDEHQTLMALWSLAPSPLMLGTNLPELDDWTLALITNDEILAVNQDPLGSPARRVARQGKTEVWVRDLKDGSKAVGLFNRGDEETEVTLQWNDASLSGSQSVRDLLHRQDLGSFENEYAAKLPRHGCALLRLRSNIRH